MEIIEVKKDKKKYIDLLLEADPEKEVIEKYIEESDMYILIDNKQVVAEIVISKVNEEECELKNIATIESARGKGYAKHLIQFAFEKYKNKFKRIIVGTTENMIPFYILNGFNTYHHTVKNFFINNYKEEIWDGDLHCIDMYYYSKDLK